MCVTKNLGLKLSFKVIFWVNQIIKMCAKYVTSGFQLVSFCMSINASIIKELYPQIMKHVTVVDVGCAAVVAHTFVLHSTCTVTLIVNILVSLVLFAIYVARNLLTTLHCGIIE